jgi:hypothetical protein
VSGIATVSLLFWPFGPIEFAGGSALQGSESAERDSLRLVAEPPFDRLALTGAGLSLLPNESVPSSLHRHHLPLFDFADGLFADREWLLGCPFSAAQADETLRTISNASSGVWTDPRMAFSTRSSERAT